MAVVLEHRAEVAVAWRIGWLSAAAAPMDERFGKALVDRAHRIVVAKMPFAKDGGVVACITQHFGQGYFIGVHHRSAAIGVEDAGSQVISASEQTRPRRAANGADIEVLQL